MELRFTQDSGDGVFTLAGDFETQAQEADSVEQSSTLSSLTAKLCDGMTQEPIHPGKPVEICVEAAPDSLVSILGILQFSFNSHSGVMQSAFNAGAADPLTQIISCDTGTICSFRTLLLTDFFVDTTTPISGNGTAELDTGSGRGALRLRRDTAQEDLVQEDDGNDETRRGGNVNSDFSFTILLASEGSKDLAAEAFDKETSGAFLQRSMYAVGYDSLFLLTRIISSLADSHFDNSSLKKVDAIWYFIQTW